MKDTAVTIKWTGNRQFIGTDSGKHSIVISSHSSDNHTGIKPSELLLLSLGACSAYDVVSILEKKRYKLDALDVVVEAFQEDDPPWTFRHIDMVFKVRGDGLKEKDVQQAAELSVGKYCSVAATLRGQADISHRIHIVHKDDET